MTWKDPYEEPWEPWAPDDIEKLKLGIMKVPFDILTQKKYLFDHYIGGKVFRDHTDLSFWIGNELDVPVWHRCAQIDFGRSTVLGYCPGEVTNGSKIEFESLQFNGKANELVARVVETLSKETPPDGVPQLSRPYQVIRLLNVGNADIHFQVIKR